MNPKKDTQKGYAYIDYGHMEKKVTWKDAARARGSFIAACWFRAVRFSTAVGLYTFTLRHLCIHVGILDASFEYLLLTAFTSIT